VKLAPICGRFTLTGLLLALAACGDGGSGSSASNVGTLAYVVTSCREVAGVATVQQELRIFHGTGETVTAMSVGPLGPFASYGLCATRGGARIGFEGYLGAFQRLGVTPDGSGVVFELTDEFNLLGQGLLPPGQRGIYYVRADGSGLRPLRPPSRVPATVFTSAFARWATGGFSFDPTGRQFTYPDLGPDDAGNEAPQLFVQGLVNGERRPLTRLPRVAGAGEPPDIMVIPGFTDGRTILFKRFAALPDRFTNLTVDTVDSQVSDVPTVALPGGTLIPAFRIVGQQWVSVSTDVPGDAVNVVLPPIWESVWEVFAMDGTNVLQLTDFRRSDTSPIPPFFSPRDQRVYFTASADPLGSNPSHDCQMFSMQPVTRDLRQVTLVHGGGDPIAGCAFGVGVGADGCASGFAMGGTPPQNPATGTIYFWSQCDPLGLNPNGQNLFAIQPDGTGLHQVTNARGFVRGADRTVEVEMPEGGLWRYAPHP